MPRVDSRGGAGVLANHNYHRAYVRKQKGDLEGTMADFRKYLELGGAQAGDPAEIEAWIQERQGSLWGGHN